MRCACIDIGTNTTRLLVAEPTPDGLRELLARRTFLPLAAGPDGAIAPALVARLARIVAEHRGMAREHGAARVRVVATAAIRSAPNRDELVAAVRRAAGLEVTVLSSQEEARLAFAGATLTLPAPPEGLVGVVDVGGGSSELVAGTCTGGVSWSASLDVGSATLAGRHLRGDRPASAELEALRAEVAGAFAAVRAPRLSAAYAVGGSATSLRRLVGPVLSPEELDGALALLAATPVAEVARRFELHAQRVRLLPAGLVVLRAAAGAFGVPLQVANGGLREGVILRDAAPAGRA